MTLSCVRNEREAVGSWLLYYRTLAGRDDEAPTEQTPGFGNEDVARGCCLVSFLFFFASFLNRPRLALHHRAFLSSRHVVKTGMAELSDRRALLPLKCRLSPSWGLWWAFGTQLRSGGCVRMRGAGGVLAPRVLQGNFFGCP